MMKSQSLLFGMCLLQLSASQALAFSEIHVLKPVGTTGTERKSVGPSEFAPEPVGSRHAKIDYFVVRQDITSLLNTMSSVYGFQVHVDGPLPGSISERHLLGTEREVMARLATEFRLFVAHDGNRYVISSLAQSAIRVIRRPGSNLAADQQIVRNLYPLLPPTAIVEDQRMQSLILRGPPLFLDAAEALLKQNASPQGSGAELTTIRFGISTRETERRP